MMRNDCAIMEIPTDPSRFASIKVYAIAIELILARITEEYDNETFSNPIRGPEELDGWTVMMHGILRDFMALRDYFPRHVNEYPNAAPGVSMDLLCAQRYLLFDEHYPNHNNSNLRQKLQ